MQSHSNPVVSIIMPVFNGAQYIRAALESVFNQTFKDYEVIVIDDGSSDGTKSVLEPWIKAGRIIYIYQSNKGLANARNTGVRQAKGTYLKFLDCDDLLYPDQLARQVEYLKDKSALVLLATDYELEFESKNKIKVQLYLKTDQLAQFIEGNPCPVHSILVQRRIVNEAGGFDEALLSHEDSDLWLRIIQRGGTFERLDYVGCCYRIHGGALSADSAKMVKCYAKFSEKLNRYLMPYFQDLPEETLRQLYFKNLNIIHQCFALEIKPAEYLPVTLEANGKLHMLKQDATRQRLFPLEEFQRIAYREYKKACRLDKEYPSKLLTVVWRNEGFYQWEKFRYWKHEPRNKKIKNILYLNSSSVIYGAETRLIDILSKLDTDKFHPYVLLPHHGPFGDRLESMGIKVIYLEYGFPIDKSNCFQKTTMMRFLRLNKQFVTILRRYDIDLIHANLHINMWKFWLAFLYVRLPLVVHMRSHFYLEIFEKMVICKSSKVIHISQFVKRRFFNKRRSDFLMGSRANHDEVIHDGLDIKRFAPRKPEGFIRKELGLSPDHFVVAIVGAVDDIKGPDLVLEAANLVVPKHPQAKFLIVGDLYHHSPENLAYRDKLHQYVKDHGLSNNVIFMGFRSDIEVLMNEIDLLVQPSKREALGTSMVEAMACGKPVIGTQVDGIPEVIGKNEAGILLKPRDAETFAQAINFFIENPQEALRRGEQGRARALKLFNVYEYLKRIEAIYREVLINKW